MLIVDNVYYKNGSVEYTEPILIELEYFLELGNKAGFITKNVDNYAGHLEYGEGEEILGILGHLDVVPVDKADWVSDPFKLSIRDWAKGGSKAR